MEFPNPKNLISINHYGRSGSYLLSNLLDSHPEVLSVPPHALIQFFPSIFSEFEKLRQVRITLDHLVDFVARECKYLFVENGKLHPVVFHYSDMRFGVKKDQFLQKFPEILASKMKEIDKIDALGLAAAIFTSIHLAYHLCLNKTLPRNFVIAFQAHNSMRLDFYQKIQPFFENITVLRTVRYPEKTFDSLLARSIKRDGIKVDNLNFHDYCRHMLRMPSDRLHQTFQDETIEGVESLNYYSVRFEDLHLNTEKIMRAIALKIGIMWDDYLLETTCDGRPFYMENVRGEYITGTNPAAPNNLDCSILSEKEKNIFSFAMQSSYRAYGYRLRPIPKYLEFENFFIPTTAHRLCMKKIFEKYRNDGRNLSSSDMRWAFKYMLHVSRVYGQLLVNRHNQKGLIFPPLISPYDHIEKFPFNNLPR